MEGTYTYVEDLFAQVSCPVLFGVGEMSKFCSIDDLEDLRQNMLAKGSAVIVVNGCNDNLSMSERKSHEQKVTQSMVAKYICCEISNYLSCLSDESSSKSTVSDIAWPSAGGIQDAKLVEKSSEEDVETPSNSSTFVKSRAPNRSRKTELQQEKLDSESITAANFLEDLLENGESSSVPSAKTNASRDTSPTGSAIVKRQKLSGIISSDDLRFRRFLCLVQFRRVHEHKQEPSWCRNTATLPPD